MLYLYCIFVQNNLEIKKTTGKKKKKNPEDRFSCDEAQIPTLPFSLTFVHLVIV